MGKKVFAIFEEVTHEIYTSDFDRVGHDVQELRTICPTRHAVRRWFEQLRDCAQGSHIDSVCVVIANDFRSAQLVTKALFVTLTTNYTIEEIEMFDGSEK